MLLVGNEQSSARGGPSLYQLPHHAAIQNGSTLADSIALAPINRQEVPIRVRRNSNNARHVIVASSATGGSALRDNAYFPLLGPPCAELRH